MAVLAFCRVYGRLFATNQASRPLSDLIQPEGIPGLASAVPLVLNLMFSLAHRLSLSIRPPNWPARFLAIANLIPHHRRKQVAHPIVTDNT